MAQGQSNYTPNSSVIWVQSRNEAENYIVGINNAVTMWSSDGTHVYMKKTDASGRPEFHAYKLVEDTNTETSEDNCSKYATRDDIASIKKRLSKIEDQIKESSYDEQRSE
jgi:hypothetical protein